MLGSQRVSLIMHMLPCLLLHSLKELQTYAAIVQHLNALVFFFNGSQNNSLEVIDGQFQRGFPHCGQVTPLITP